jgi:hypothetical protein
MKTGNGRRIDLTCNIEYREIFASNVIHITTCEEEKMSSQNVDKTNYAVHEQIIGEMRYTEYHLRQLLDESEKTISEQQLIVNSLMHNNEECENKLNEQQEKHKQMLAELQRKYKEQEHQIAKLQTTINKVKSYNATMERKINAAFKILTT